MLKVGINGFGRIGRAIFRILSNCDFATVSVINDVNPDIENIAYCLAYDSTYGIFQSTVECGESGNLIVGGDVIRVMCEQSICEVDWGDVDVVIESTGVFDNIVDAASLTNFGIAKIFITNHPSRDFVDATLIHGVTDLERLVDPSVKVIAGSICDSNAIAPFLSGVLENTGIVRGSVTTLHPWLSYQNLLDGPAKSYSYPGTTSDQYALGRSAVNCLIPKNTSAVRAVEDMIPELRGRLWGMSFRVPTNAVSCARVSLELEGEPVGVEDLINYFERRQVNQKYSVFKVSHAPLVSADFIGDPHSCILDTRWLTADSNRIEAVLWYDNEWAYAARICDLLHAYAN